MGNLAVVATPIGNIEDLSLRAVRAIAEADFIACEDTRSFGIFYERIFKVFENLVTKPEFRPRLISFYEGNEAQKEAMIIDLLSAGQNGCLVSQAGTPLISDPGYKLVRRCLEEKIWVTPLPGPCAATAAISVSGLSADRFMFLGFLPKKQSKRNRLLEAVSQMSAKLSCTLVIYESPYRLKKTLVELMRWWPEAEGVVSREMTKLHEELIRGKLDKLASHFEKPPKGEIVILARVG